MLWLRWILVLPGAILLGMAGSLAGGIVASVFGQAAMDTSSAFFGSFAGVCGAVVIAPSNRGKVQLVAACVVALLALGSFALGVFTTAEEFASLSAREKILTPVAQFLGALYAFFIVPSLLTPGAPLEGLWRDVLGLGICVGMFGAIIALVGLVIGLFGHGWIGLWIGLGVLLLSALTWLFPFVHLGLRVRRAKALIAEQMHRPRRDPRLVMLFILMLMIGLVIVYILRGVGIPAPLKAIIVWVILVYLGTNLIGCVVRGLVHQGLEDGFENEYLRGELRRLRRWDTVFTAGWVLLSLGYLYLLFHWWNLAVAIAALVLMLTRLPSLIFEIQMGLSYSAEARKLSASIMPGRVLGALCTTLDWLALPLLWWGLRR